MDPDPSWRQTAPPANSSRPARFKHPAQLGSLFRISASGPPTRSRKEVLMTFHSHCTGHPAQNVLPPTRRTIDLSAQDAKSLPAKPMGITTQSTGVSA